MICADMRMTDVLCLYLFDRNYMESFSTDFMIIMFSIKYCFSIQEKNYHFHKSKKFIVDIHEKFSFDLFSRYKKRHSWKSYSEKID